MLSTKYITLKASKGKLKPRFIGPYQVVSAVGANAFRLELPPALTIHPVFNTSLLKKYTGDRLVPEPVLLDGSLEYEVESILAHRGSARCR